MRKSLGKLKPPPSLWGFITNNSGLSIAFLTVSKSSKLHSPAKHSRSLAMSSLLSRYLLAVLTQKLGKWYQLDKLCQANTSYSHQATRSARQKWKGRHISLASAHVVYMIIVIPQNKIHPSNTFWGELRGKWWWNVCNSIQQHLFLRH